MLDAIDVAVRYTVTTGAVEYGVPFPIYEPGDVRVSWSADGRTACVLRLGTEYTVRVNASGGGAVLLTAETASRIPSGAVLAVTSALPAVQEADFSSTATVDTRTLETQLDRQVQLIRQLEAGLSRAVAVPEASEQDPQALADELFAARDAASASARAAGASEAAAAASLARTVEAEAQALRELREEGADQQERLTRLADTHLITLRREVEAGHAEADRAAQEADRAAAAVDRAAQTATLGVSARNLEATWRTAEALSAGTELILPLVYFPGRNMLRLSWGGAALYAGSQYEELGPPDTASDRVRLLFDLPAGAQLNAWAVASNTARHVEEARLAAELAAELATQQADRAVAETAHAAAAATAQAAEAARNAAQARTRAEQAEQQARLASNLAQEATEQADRADEAAEDAVHAARSARAAACLAGQGRLFTLRDPAGLKGAPQGFYVIDAGLAVPALAALPLTCAARLEDIPNLDCYAVLGTPMPCPDAGSEGDGGPAAPESPGTPDPAPTPCGKRRRLHQAPGTPAG